MPKPIGSPVTVSGAQPQREVARFQVDVVYDSAGAPHFTFAAFGQTTLRDNSGNIVYQQPFAQIGTAITDANIPTAARGWFTSICQFLDTQ